MTISRGGKMVAEIRPATRRTGRDLRAALQGIAPPEDRFERDIAEAVALLDAEGEDPWGGR